MDVTLDNSTITVTGTTDGQNSFQIDDQAILTLQNGSAIKGVRDFNILTGAQPSISVDGTSSVSATNVSIADGVANGSYEEQRWHGHLCQKVDR